MSDTLYVIPAKKDSRRFPGKNRLAFGGLTMLERTLRDIGDSPDRVVVISDDTELLVEAGALGCRVLAEPGELCQPGVSAWRAVEYALAEHDWMRPEIVCAVQMNVVHRPAGTVQNLVGMLRGAGLPLLAVIPVERVPDRWHPAYMVGLPDMDWLRPAEHMLPTENLTPVYASSLAAAYAVRAAWVGHVARGGCDALRDAKFRTIAGLIVPTGEAIEIDTPEDFAEALKR